jgi:hypothetical protein
LRFCDPGGTLSRWRFHALFWALNFAVLRSRSRAFFLQRSVLSLFSRFFFLRAPALLFSFALASAKARKREKSAGAQLWQLFIKS